MTATHPWRFSAVLLVGAMFHSAALAQPSEKNSDPPFKLPAVFSKAAPENANDLREMEAHVQKVVIKVMPSVVGLRIGNGQGSGVIVSEDGYVLTAGHVSGDPHQTVRITFPDGKELKGKSLGRNIDVDSGLIKITSEGKFPFLEMGQSSDLKLGQWVIAIGQPGGFRPGRAPVVRVGRILSLSRSVIRTDCALVGGDSGGPLFDMQGRVIGIHSRIGDTIHENVHVPVDNYRKTWTRLAKGESWGTRISESMVVSAGGKIVFEKKDKLTANDPKDTEQENSHRKIFNVPLKAGYTYTIDMLGSDKSGKKFDPFLRLENAEGKETAQADDGAGFPDARIVYKAPKDGAYRIIATTSEANQTGAFHLIVREADMFTGTVELLRAVHLPAPAVAKTLDELAQTDIRLHISIYLYDRKGKPQSDQEITFRWDQGKETLETGPDGSILWPLKKERHKKLTVQIPKGLRASINLADQKGNDLPFFYDTKEETVKSAGGAIVKTIDGVLTSKDPIDRKRENCHAKVVELKMSADKIYTIDLVSEDFDAYLRLETSQGKILQEDDDGGGMLNSRIVFSPKNDETFRIVITTCDPEETGSYRLTIREISVKQK
jgi:serine protease Do